MKVSNIVAGILIFALCLSAEASDRKYIVKPRPGERKSLPFSEGVLVGNTLYMAGHIGLDDKTGMPPASAEEEARMVMNSIKQTVEQAGLTMDDIVTMQIFCTDLKWYDTFNGVYQTYFHGDYPARAFVGSNNILRGGRYEVMGVAVKRGQ
ncbi:MAG TPA: Rid family hydrolase [Candidatus Sulfotelmatobacter sp.]